MSTAEKGEANNPDRPLPLLYHDLDRPMNPFAPTRAQFILLLIGLLFALDRRSIIRILPWHVGLVGGIIPPECLMWTLILADMAKGDIVHTWYDIKTSSSSRDQSNPTEGE